MVTNECSNFLHVLKKVLCMPIDVHIPCRLSKLTNFNKLIMCSLYIKCRDDASLASVDMFTKFKRGADCLLKIVIWVIA